MLVPASPLAPVSVSHKGRGGTTWGVRPPYSRALTGTGPVGYMIPPPAAGASSQNLGPMCSREEETEERTPTPE